MTIATIAVTGTRQTAARLETLAALFADLLDPHLHPDRAWLLGGAAGVDTLALAHLAAAGPGAGRLTVAVPVRAADQPADARAGIEHARAAGRLDRLVELAHPEGIGPAAFTARNRWLVEHADLVIGFPLTGADDGSGTWETLRHAAGRGTAYLVAPLERAR